MLLGELHEETRCRLEDQIDPTNEFGKRQVFDDAEINADQTSDILEGLPIHPLLAARNDRELTCSQRQ